MGNCCIPQTPCGSVEERSVLLKNDGKAAQPAGERCVEGTCGPDGDDEIRKLEDKDTIKAEEKAEAEHEKQSPENGLTEPINTQENGPLMKESIEPAAESPGKESEHKSNSTRAQDEAVKEPPDHPEQTDLLRSTLDPQPNVQAAAHWEAFMETNAVPKEVNPAAVQDKLPDGISAESSCSEKPSQTEKSSSAEHTAMLSSCDDEVDKTVAAVASDGAVTAPSEEISQNGDTPLASNSLPAPNAGPVIPKPVVSQESNKEAPSCAATEDSDSRSSSLCELPGHEDIKSRDVPESSPGPEPAQSQSPGLDHIGEPQAEPASSTSVTTASVDAPERSKPDQKADRECSATSPNEVTTGESAGEDVAEEMMHVEEGDVAKEAKDDVKDEEAAVTAAAAVVVLNAASEAEAPAEKEAETQEVTVQEEQLGGNTAADVKLEVFPGTEREESTEVHMSNSEEDLYRAAEDLPVSQFEEPGPQSGLETTVLKVEDRCSLDPAVDVVSYSEREWKGNTAKSVLIRKGYKSMSQKFSSVRRVRGDNYCALRATLFQMLSHSTQLPAWLQEDDSAKLLKQLEEQEGLISQWIFLQGHGTGDVVQQLKSYMDLLRNKWRAAADCSSAVERRQLCERVFQGGEEELGLLEALKLLMLARAVELHGLMQDGGDVPLFCWLLFARDTSDCPRSFLSNHLSHVGRGAGLEQVEMFLLGYALRCTIQVYRLYKAGTEEFITHYPDDHKDDWPSVCLVTEDDRHYNVPVEAAELHKKLKTS